MLLLLNFYGLKKVAISADFATRIEQVRNSFDQRGLDGFIIASPTNRTWISGFTGTSGTVVITKDAKYFVTDSRYWEQARIECPDFELVEAIGAVSSLSTEFLMSFTNAQLGFESNHVTVDQINNWRSSLEESGNSDCPKLRSISGLIEALRMVKDHQELEALSKAVYLGDKAFKEATTDIQLGITEKDVAWSIQEYAITHGASDLSFPSIVASGEHAALPHWRASDSELISGSGVVIDMGVILDGYCSDLTRTIWFRGESSQEPSDQFLRVYDVVRMAQEMAIERIEAGMLGSEAHEIARTVIDEAGYGDFFGHGLGHGVGLDVHEEPRLSPLGDVKLADGHVVTVEPGIYIPGWGGVRIEDQCVMENGRLRSLTTSSKNFPA